MRIGISQINTVAGAFEATVERMVAQSQRAAEQNVDVLLFPLAALAGVEPVPYADAPSFMRDLAEATALLSEQLACPAIVPVPMDLGSDQATYDALLLQDGEVQPICLMSQRLKQDAAEEWAVRGVPRIEFAGEQLALAFSHADLDRLIEGKAEGIITLFFSPYPFALDDPSSAMAANLEAARFVADVQTTNSWLVGVASVGGYGEQVFSGSSFVMAPSGRLVASAPAFEEALLVAELGGDEPEQREGMAMPELFDAPFHLWQALSLGIHDFVTKRGCSDVALCLDGTLGSMMLAALASDAMGPTHVHALVGASAGARGASCRELLRRLRVEEVTAVGYPRGLDLRDTDELELARLAGECNALPLSSLDKTALSLGIGMGRLNGALLAPLGDVYRSDVLDMAHVRNTISPIFRRVGLSEADALSLPAPDGTTISIASEAELTQVDEILLGYVEYDRPLYDLVADGANDVELTRAVLTAQREAELVRRSLPPVLVMSTHTLDEARFPLSISWHDRHLDGYDMQAEGLDLSFPPSFPSFEDTGGDDAGQRFARRKVDLQSTFDMLRDFMEQGGFMPPGATPDNPEPFAKGFPEAIDDNPIGWFSPFSEN